MEVMTTVYPNYDPHMQPSPYSQRLSAMTAQQPFGGYTQRAEIVRVNGENGARAYQLPPNSSALMLDENEPLVWLKTTDGAGYPSLTPYTIAPYTPPTSANTGDLEARVKRLEEMFNAEPDSASAAKQSKPESAK